MKRTILGIMLFLALPLWGQTTTPRPALVSPVIRFFDTNGKPLVGGRLFTYTAGTTTPIQTYKDSTSGTLNTNPVILDSAGQANGVFLDPTVTYKFVLQNSAGVQQWTADNISQGGGGTGGNTTCMAPQAIIYAVGDGTTGCDSLITIDPIGHTLNVGGAITTNAFTLKNLTTIPNSWTFDVTTPNTALLSLGPVPLTDLATQAADTVVMNATASTAAPTAVAVPDCPNAITYTGHTWTCTSFTPTPAYANYSGNLSARNGGTTYQNTSGKMMYVSGSVQTVTAGSTGTVYCYVSSTSPPTQLEWKNAAGATPPSSSYGFSCMVLPNYYYMVRADGAISSQQDTWVEVTF